MRCTVTLKTSNAVAVLGIIMAGPGSSNEVAGSVELLVQEMTGVSHTVGSVSSKETLLISLFVSCGLSEFSSELVVLAEWGLLRSTVRVWSNHVR